MAVSRDAVMLVPLLAALLGASGAPVLGSVGSSRKLAAQVDEANAAFGRGDLDEAFRGYSDALLLAPDAPQLQFNLGDVHYRKGDFDQAAKAFEGASADPDPRRRAAAWYNRGNALVRTGGATGDMNLLQKAIESYQQALKLDPTDVDAKYNIEYVQRKLKENAQRQQQDQQQQDQQQQDQQQQDQQQQDQQKQDQQQNQQKNKQEQDKQEDKKNGEESQGDSSRLDEKQAQQWLDRLREQEQKDLKEQMRKQVPGQGEVLRDW